MNCILGWLFSSSEYISITPSDLPNTISGIPVAETSWTPILAIPKEERERGGEREGGEREGGRERGEREERERGDRKGRERRRKREGRGGRENERGWKEEWGER